MSAQIAWTLFRACVLLGFVLLWPQLVCYMGKRKGISREQIQYFAKQKWLVGLWFVIFDLIIVENIFQYI